MDDVGYFLLVHLDSDVDDTCLIRVMARYWPETDQQAVGAQVRRRMKYAVHAAHLRALSNGETVNRIIWEDGDTTKVLDPVEFDLERPFANAHRPEHQVGRLLQFRRDRR
jgi:hypothetical protein